MVDIFINTIHKIALCQIAYNIILVVFVDIDIFYFHITYFVEEK